MGVLRAFLPRLTLTQWLVIGSLLSVMGGGVLTVVVVLVVLGSLGGTIGPPPEQPIAFDHTIHAGDASIACEFCHRGAPVQAAATVPTVEQCMFCHGVIATDTPGVQLLQARWETEQPINWTRVHRLPDHVKFEHEPHIRAFSADGIPTDQVCATCHGDVKTMTEVKQVRSLNMGDCQSCHREMSASLDCATCHN